MEKISLFISKTKEQMSQQQYIDFLESIKKYCDIQINENAGERHKTKMLQLFIKFDNICTFIKSCKFIKINEEIKKQSEIISVNKIIIKNDHIFISIKTSLSQSDKWGDGPEEIEIDFGKNEETKEEILSERCVFAGETFNTILEKQEFKKTLEYEYNQIKNKDIIISHNDVYLIIKEYVNLFC